MTYYTSLPNSHHEAILKFVIRNRMIMDNRQFESEFEECKKEKFVFIKKLFNKNVKRKNFYLKYGL